MASPELDNGFVRGPANQRTGLLTVSRPSRDGQSASTIHISQNPLIADYILMMRDQNCPATQFRYNVGEIAHLLAYEACGLLDLPRADVEIQLPGNQSISSQMTDSAEVSIVAPTRSGLVLADAVKRYFPHAPEGHVVFGRTESGAPPKVHHSRLAPRPTIQTIFVDATIATGSTAKTLVAEVERKHQQLPKGCFICIACSTHGAASFFDAFPSIPIVAGTINDVLDEDSKQLVPGFGEVGDRIYNTEYDLNSHRDI